MNTQATPPAPPPTPGRGEPSPAQRKYQAAFGTAAVAGAFCLVVALSMLGRYWREQRYHPLASPLARRLDEARAELTQDPTNQDLREFIRRADRIVTYGYRRNQAFYDRGAYLLIGGAVVFLVAAGIAVAARGALPVPGASPEGYDTRVRRWGRWALGGLIVLLLGGGGLLSMSSSELDYQLAAAPPGGTGPQGPVAAPPATASAAAPTPATRPAPHPAAPEPAPPTNGWPRVATFPTWPEIARQWNRFRGPGGRGHAGSANVPLSFDGATGKNIAWKTEVPLPGHSSPVVWGDRVFLTGGTVARRCVFCFDAATGTCLWTHNVREIPGGKVPKSVTERMMVEDTGYAACTPLADAERVYAIFATGEIVCLEHDGTKVWGRYLGPMETEYGHAASLAMHVVHATKARIIVQLDQGMEEEGKSRLVVLDAATGRIDGSVTKRPVGSSWTTPIVIPAPGGDQIITLANPWVIAYAAANGKELWRAEVLEGDGAPSATYAAGLVLAGNTSSYMAAIRPDGRGNVTKTKVAWLFEQDIPDVCTPVADDKYVYMLTSDGLITCIDLKTGKKVYAHDLEMPFVASPTIAGDKLVVLGRKGVLVAGTRGPKFKEVVRSQLGEQTQATPALVDGAMFLRGKKHLYCIREGAQLKVAPTSKPAPVTDAK